MSVLAKFEKQPADVQDYDIDFSDWLAGMSDTAMSQVSTISGPDAAATLTPSASLVDDYVKVWVTGGTTGKTYRVTTTMTTAAGRVKQAEIDIKVKEV